MGFLQSLKQILGGKSSGAGGGGRSGFGDDAHVYWVHAQCRRCGEPLRTRIDLRNEPSEEDDGGFVVHKALTGSGKYYCFQTVDVTLHFDRQKKTVVSSDVAGGQLITAEEYPALLTQWHEEQARRAAEQAG